MRSLQALTGFLAAIMLAQLAAGCYMTGSEKTKTEGPENGPGKDGWVELFPFGPGPFDPDSEEMPPEVGWNDLHFVDAQTGWIVGGYDSAFAPQLSRPVSVILKTTDGGETWVRQASDIQTTLHGVFFVDNLRGWAVGASGGVRTVDGGETWIPMGTDWDGDFEGQSGRSVFFLDALHGWIGGEGDGAYGAWTTDGGVTWNVRENQIGTFIQFVDPETGWRHTSSGNLFKTLDGGATWTEQHAMETEDEFVRSPRNAFFLNASTGWMVGRNGVIQKTTDGGETWMSQESGTSADLTSVGFTDANTGMVTGRGATLKTSDGGATWSVVDTVADLGRLSLLPTGRGYALGGDRIFRW